jgi:hypothetical protein
MCSAVVGAEQAVVAAGENDDNDNNPGPVVAEKVIAHSAPPKVMLLYLGLASSYSGGRQWLHALKRLAEIQDDLRNLRTGRRIFRQKLSVRA